MESGSGISHNIKHLKYDSMTTEWQYDNRAAWQQLTVHVGVWFASQINYEIDQEQNEC